MTANGPPAAGADTSAFWNDTLAVMVQDASGVYGEVTPSSVAVCVGDLVSRGDRAHLRRGPEAQQGAPDVLAVFDSRHFMDPEAERQDSRWWKAWGGDWETGGKAEGGGTN